MDIDLDKFVPPPQLSHQNLAARADVSDFTQLPTGAFDIGVDRNSQQLVLLWEAWHKQMSHALYLRTGKRVLFTQATGAARMQITVTRDHQITGEPLSASGDPRIAAAYFDAVQSLNGNPGLTFPPGSQRDFVTFSYQYIQGANVLPGYNWKHGDQESVQQDY